MTSWKVYTIPVQNIILQFLVVEHFFWVMFAHFVMDYWLNTISKHVWFLFWTLIVDENCLKRKLDADASKCCICSKICLTLSSNACVSSSSLMILKRVEGKAYTSSWLSVSFPPSSYSGFSNNVSVLIWSLALILFLKNSNSLVFCVQSFPVLFLV